MTYLAGDPGRMVHVQTTWNMNMMHLKESVQLGANLNRNDLPYCFDSSHGIFVIQSGCRSQLFHNLNDVRSHRVLERDLESWSMGEAAF